VSPAGEPDSAFTHAGRQTRAWDERRLCGATAGAGRARRRKGSDINASNAAGLHSDKGTPGPALGSLAASSYAKAPSVDPSAYVAPSAELHGNITVGPRGRVMSGAVLDAEGSRVEVSECAIVCEHAILRATAVGDRDHPVTVGDHAFVSPRATLLGCEVEAATYVATGATVLHGGRVETGAVVAVGGLVHGGTVLPSGFFLAPGMIAIGDPVATYAPGDPSLPDAIRDVGFAGRAFGVSTAWEDRTARYREIAEVRSEEFGAHAGDEAVAP
jgi:carbonic anhydrase/acetyltransferase-like protein (isoleucine patch superfamily)